MNRDSSSQDLNDLEARIEKLERAGSNYRLYIAAEERIRRERRYALLQAAATIYASTGLERREDKLIRICSTQSAAGEAEELLAEIEKREADRQAEAESRCSTCGASLSHIAGHGEFRATVCTRCHPETDLEA